MRRVVPASLVLLALVPQACQRDEVSAPRRALEADAAHSRAPDELTFTVQPPEAIEASAVIAPGVRVSVTDASGAPVPGSVVRLELGTSPTPGATLSGTTQVKLVDGVATFDDLRIDRPGRGYTLQARAGRVSGVSAPFAIVGPAAQLTFLTQPPANVEGTEAMAPAVRVAVQDALGSTVPSATELVRLALGANPSGATLAGTTSMQAVHGIATFADLAVDRPGSGYTLAATAPSLAGVTSSAFAIHLTFAALSTGAANHTCGVTTSRAAYCWGHNAAGEIGDGTRMNRSSPVLVGGGLRFVALGTGGETTCGVTTTGAAYCWGDNQFGQLGDGTSQNQRASPVLVTGGLDFAALAVSYFHACGVATDGVAYCWGANDAGELGDQTRTSRSSPAPVAGGLTFARVSVGAQFSCGVTTDAAADCWGHNSFGQRGDGSTGSRTVPAGVAGGRSFAALSTGPRHVC